MAANKTSLSAGIIIRELLTQDADVAAITNHVFPVVTDTAKLPYICYRRTSLESVPVKGSVGSNTVAVEVLCYADDYDQSLELAEAVSAALNNRQAQVDDLVMRSCVLTDSEEGWQDDAYVQQLIFTVKIF